MALDLVRRGQRVTLLDDDNTVGVRGLASRGMVWAQRTLDIFDRWTWPTSSSPRGALERRARAVPRCGSRLVHVAGAARHAPQRLREPAAILSGSLLVEALQREPLAELRWLNRVDAIDSPADGGPVTLRVHARGRLPHAGRMGDRLRRRQQPAAPGAGPAARGVRPQRRPLDHHRRGAARYVWPEERWTGWTPAATTAGPSGATRWPTTPGGWTSSFAPTRTRRPPARRRPCASASGTCWANRSISISPARRLGLSPRMPARPASWPRAVRRRLGAPVAPFGARRQRRHPGRRQPGLETGAGAAGTRQRHAARQLQRRAQARGAGEHPPRGARRASCIPARPNRRACGATPSSRWPRATTCPRA